MSQLHPVASTQGTTLLRAKGSGGGSMQQAELAVLDALRAARGRGKEGLSDAALSQLNLAVSVLESNGGVAGASLRLAGCS